MHEHRTHSERSLEFSVRFALRQNVQHSSENERLKKHVRVGFVDTKSRTHASNLEEISHILATTQGKFARSNESSCICVCCGGGRHFVCGGFFVCVCAPVCSTRTETTRARARARINTMTCNFKYETDDEENVIAFGVSGNAGNAATDVGGGVIADRDPKKRRRIERVSDKRLLEEWRRRENLRFGIADPRTLRRYCLEYLAASQSPAPAIVDNEENFSLPALASAEMDCLIQRCRAWRETNWHAEMLNNRKRHEQQQRELRRVRDRQHRTETPPLTPTTTTSTSSPPHNTAAAAVDEEEFLAALLLCDLRK